MKILLVLFFIILFQDIAVSQKCDSITISVGRKFAHKRYTDSVSNYFITGYWIGDTIQKITEHLTLHRIDILSDYRTTDIFITYAFQHGLLAETNDSVAEDPKDSLRLLVPLKNNSNAYYTLGNRILKYSKEDDSLLRNSDAFINRKR